MPESAQPAQFGDLTVGVQSSPQGAVITLSGELDVYSSARLREVIDGLAPDVREVVVDVGDVSFIDSSGLGAIVRLHNTLAQREGRVAIRSAPRRLYRLFEISGLTKVLDVEPRDSQT